MSLRMTEKLMKLFIVMILFLTGCQDVSEGTPAASRNPETAEPAGSEKDQETIVILHTNDVHCALNDKIGYDGLYLYKEEMEQKYKKLPRIGTVRGLRKGC